MVARARKTGALGAGSGRQANQSQAIAKSLDDFRRRLPPRTTTTQRGPSPLQPAPIPLSRLPLPPSATDRISQPPSQSCCSCNAPPSPWLDGPPSRPSCAAPSRPPSSAVSLIVRQIEGRGRRGAQARPIGTCVLSREGPAGCLVAALSLRDAIGLPSLEPTNTDAVYAESATPANKSEKPVQTLSGMPAPSSSDFVRPPCCHSDVELAHAPPRISSWQGRRREGRQKTREESWY